MNKNWRNVDKLVSCITDHKTFGGKMKDNLYETAVTDLSPVFDNDVELNFCSCQNNCKSVCSKYKKEEPYVYRDAFLYKWQKW